MYAYFTPISYQVNLNVGAGGKTNLSSINVSYGLKNTFTVTPNPNYYLENITCTNGYTVSGFTTTTSSTGTQTITISNNNKLSGSTCTISFKALCPYSVGSTWDFNYTGGVQSFTAKCTGTYKLEVWGAQGGSESNNIGGKGGYSVGNITLNKNSTIYVVVGSNTNGYNGGGYNADSWDSYGYMNVYGGGATHIAFTNRGELKNYASYKSDVLIVAGGGGGAGFSSNGSYPLGNGGTGGGENGGKGNCMGNDCENSTAGVGGTQNNGYAFGVGSSICNYYSGPGGGGWYGGTSGYNRSGGGGGSGYIGGVTNGSTQNGIREGNGFARIKVLSLAS